MVFWHVLKNSKFWHEVLEEQLYYKETYSEVVNLLLQFSSSRLQRPDMCHRVTVIIITIVTMAIVSSTSLLRCGAEEA